MPRSPAPDRTGPDHRGRDDGRTSAIGRPAATAPAGPPGVWSKRRPVAHEYFFALALYRAPLLLAESRAPLFPMINFVA